MKQLDQQFYGTGEVRGYIFTRLKSKETAYIYRVENLENDIHYEVFKHKENNYYNCVSYPTSKAFGIWAWTYDNLRDAIIKFDSL